MKRNLFAALVLVATSSSAVCAQDNRVGVEMNRFLDRWSQGAGIRAADVDELYAPQVHYYGHQLSRSGILREKRSIARKWPDRRYEIVPGSTSYRCTADRSRCHVTGVLRWTVRHGGHGGSGASSLTLDMVRAGAAYQIVAESGSVLARGSAIH